MRTAEETLALVDVAFCLPVVLIINFSLFQYLATTFWRRRQERRVRLLLFVAALSFVSVIPFAFPDPELMEDLNDISEVSSVLTFLLQITVLTRDVGKRIKIRTLWVLTWVGELLVVLSLFILIANVVDIVAPVIDMSLMEELDDVVENVSLLFIVGFRFYFLAIAKGYRKVWATQKTEIFCYTLFLTHEYPFMALNHVTGWSWEHVQGVWMRATIVMCLWMTVKARLTSQSSKLGLTTTQHGGGAGPSRGSVFDSQPQLSPVKPTRPTSAVQVSAPTFRSIAAVVPQASVTARLKSQPGKR